MTMSESGVGGISDEDLMELDRRIDKLIETNDQIKEFYMSDPDCKQALIENEELLLKLISQMRVKLEMYRNTMLESHPLWDKYQPKKEAEKTTEEKKEEKKESPKSEGIFL